MTNHIEEIVEELSILSMERISPYTATTRDFKASAMEIVKAYGDQRAEEGFKEGYEAGKKDIFKMNGVQPLSTPPNTTES